VADNSDQPTPPQPEQPQGQPPSASAGKKPFHFEGGDIIAFGVLLLVFLIVVPLGVLNILAALNRWNPLNIEGRLWTGVFMIAAPATLVIVNALPYRIRKDMPESVGCLIPLAVWIALFFAFCSGK